jgi:polyhydroxyalkanoate synthesis regulator phasin
MATKTRSSGGRRGGGSSTRRRAASAESADVGRTAGYRDVILKTMFAPLNAVLLTRRHIEEVAEDAVQRGRMTRDDAQQLIQSLLQRGARQTDDFLADLERLLGRGREFEETPAATDVVAQRRKRSRRPAASLPIADYDDLSAAAVQERLDSLTPAELRKLRDYERRHANRKTVLDPIERKLR